MDPDRKALENEISHHIRGEPVLALFLGAIVSFGLPMFLAFGLMIWLPPEFSVLGFVPLIAAILVERRHPGAILAWGVFVGGALARLWSSSKTG